jgi:hypothetical protein
LYQLFFENSPIQMGVMKLVDNCTDMEWIMGNPAAAASAGQASSKQLPGIRLSM